MTPIDFFWASVRSDPQAEAAIELAADGRIVHRLNYAALAEQVNTVAAAFQQLSGAHRPRVVLASRNSMAMLVCILAAYQCRGVLIPLTPKNPEAELRQQIEVARPDLIVLDDASGALASGQPVPVISIGHEADGRPLFEPMPALSGIPAIEEAAGEDIVAMKFTGGSSGRPRPCCSRCAA